MRLHSNQWYCGFCDGKPYVMPVDDKWGGAENIVYRPALFKNKAEAKMQFQDVRLVEINEVKP